MNQISCMTTPRSLDELKAASKHFVDLHGGDSENDLQAFFDEIFSSALIAIAAVDPHEAIYYPLDKETPMAGKTLDTASHQDLRDELRSAVIPLMLMVFTTNSLPEKQSMKLLMLLAAYFGLSKAEVAIEMTRAASNLGLTK